MWKCIARGVRETLERGANFGRADIAARNPPDRRTKTGCQNVFSYTVVNGEKSIGDGQNESKQENKGRSNEDKWDGAAHGVYEHTWLGALGYSSALVLGWMLSQHMCRWGNVHHHNAELRLQESRYIGLTQLFRRVAVAQPLNAILPRLTAGTQVNTADPAARPFGPITADQAVEEAAEELHSVHNLLVGEWENRRGVDCMSRRRDRDAILHFREATQHNYAPAAFNLAQCHELGLGTRQDFAEAAHWYQVAANLGHSSAMYNLGVFYVHGWGGLRADTKQARELFTAAAKLGQKDAQVALDLEKTKACAPPPKPANLKVALTPLSSSGHNSSLSKNPSNGSLLKNPSFDWIKFFFSPLVPKQERKTEQGCTGILRFSEENATVGQSKTSDSSLILNNGYNDGCAEYYAGLCHENGWGVPANLSMAAEYFSAAAFTGNATALYNLAVCYETGPTGVKQDPQLVVELYRMAADQGHLLSSQRLQQLTASNNLNPPLPMARLSVQ